LTPKTLRELPFGKVVASLPAVAINPSARSAAAESTVILVELGPEEHALVANALGADVALLEVRLDELSNLRDADSSVVVCRARPGAVERVARALGAEPGAPPIVALCADSAAARAALGAGAHDCLVTPHIENLLVACVRRAVAHQKLERDCRRLERSTEREPQQNQQPNLAQSVANGRWLQNVLPLDPFSKSSESHSLSIAESDSDVDGEVELAQALSPEQHL